MPKTLSDVRTVVRDHIDEPTASWWTNAELNRAINRAKDSLWRLIYTMRADYFEASTSLSLTANTDPPVYDLPAAFGRLKSIRVTTSGSEHIKFTPSDRAAINFVEGLRADLSIANPTEYLFDILVTAGTFGGSPAVPQQRIMVSPIVRSALTARVEYHQIVPDLTGDTEYFGILDPFVEFIEAKATQYALLKGPSGDWKAWWTVCENMKPEVKSALQVMQMHRNEVVEGFLEDHA